MNTVNTNITKVFIDNEGIVNVKLIDKIDIHQHDVEDAHNAVSKLTNGGRYCTIFDARNITIGHVSSKAFRYHSINNFNKNKMGEAIVLNSIGIRILANFYLNVFKPEVPTKIFTNFEEARKWLRKIKQQNRILNN